MELKSSHAGLTQAINGLSRSIDRQGQKIDKLDELRIDFASHKTRLEAACDELKDTKAKLDRVHTFVVGAAAVIAFLVVAAQVALRVWPLHEQPPVIVTAPSAAPAVTPTAPPVRHRS